MKKNIILMAVLAITLTSYADVSYIMSSKITNFNNFKNLNAGTAATNISDVMGTQSTSTSGTPSTSGTSSTSGTPSTSGTSSTSSPTALNASSTSTTYNNARPEIQTLRRQNSSSVNYSNSLSQNPNGVRTLEYEDQFIYGMSPNQEQQLNNIRAKALNVFNTNPTSFYSEAGQLADAPLNYNMNAMYELYKTSTIEAAKRSPDKIASYYTPDQYQTLLMIDRQQLVLAVNEIRCNYESPASFSACIAPAQNAYINTQQSFRGDTISCNLNTTPMTCAVDN